MEDLIEALQIFLKYNDSKWPTSCEHDILYILDIDADDVSTEDKARLYELGFLIDEDNGFFSFRYG